MITHMITEKEQIAIDNFDEAIRLLTCEVEGSRYEGWDCLAAGKFLDKIERETG